MYVKEMARLLLLLVMAAVRAQQQQQQQYLGPVAAPFVIPPPALTDSERRLKSEVDSYLSAGSRGGADLMQRYDVGISEYFKFFPWNRKMLFDAHLLTLRESEPATSYLDSNGEDSEGQQRSHLFMRGPPNKAQFGTKPAGTEQSFMMRFITKYPFVVTLVQLSLMSLLTIAVTIAVAACVTYNDGRDGHAANGGTKHQSFRETGRKAVRETDGKVIRDAERGDECKAVRGTIRELASKKAQTENERKSRYQNFDYNYAKFCPKFMSQEEEVFGRHVIGVVLNDGSIIKISGGFNETPCNKRNDALNCATS